MIYFNDSEAIKCHLYCNIYHNEKELGTKLSKIEVKYSFKFTVLHTHIFYKLKIDNVFHVIEAYSMF